MKQRFEEILTKVGLTSQESRTYLALLRIQESQTGGICKNTGIASSNIYNILDSLIKKGLVGYRVQNNIKIFMPASPETLNELFLEKEKRLEQEREEVTSLIASLKKERIEEPYSKYKYYEGFINIKSMWHEINSSLPNLDTRTIIKIHAPRKGAYENLIGFYNEYHKLRHKLKLRQKMILPLDEKALAKEREKQLSDIRFMKLNNEVEWGVVGDMFYMNYITGKTPRGFLIHDEKFAKTFGQAFDNLWKNAKK